MTTYPDMVWRKEVTATKVDQEDPVSPVVLIPENVFDVTLYVKASAAATGKVEESPSSGAAISTQTGDVWLSVHASLDSVGSTLVRCELGNRVPVALRLSSLTTDETATMVVVGKRMR